MTTVFYAWQSDRDEHTCRFLIRDAAKIAVKKLASDVEVKNAPAIDEAIKGVSGHPHVAATIRKKIRNCGCFLCDLTHVTDYKTADGRTKKAQNGNVLIELGIAMGRNRGFEKLIMVMNDHYGKPEDLPFDLKSHSFPITYTLAPGSDHATISRVKADLAARLVTKLRPILQRISEENREKSASQRSDEWLGAVREKRAAFDHNIEQPIIRMFHGLAGKRMIFAVSVLPTEREAKQLTLTEQPLLKAGGYLRPFCSDVGMFKPSTHSLACRLSVSTDPDECIAVSEISNRGEIYGAFHVLWSMKEEEENAEAIATLPMDYYEPRISISILDYLKLLKELGIGGPYAVCLSLLGARNSVLVPSRKSFLLRPTTLQQQNLICDPLIIEHGFKQNPHEFAKLLRPMWNQFWRGYGHLYGAKSYHENTGEYLGFAEFSDMQGS